MKTLFVNACTGSQSKTLDLAQHLLSKLPGEITEVKLNNENAVGLPKPVLQKNKADSAFLKKARQFAEADTVVIAAPFWNRSSPASVKAYFDDILIPGITFDYDENDNLVGKVKAEKMIYVTTADGPIFNDFGYSYVKTISRLFLDIDEIRCYSAENLDMVDVSRDTILKKTKFAIDKDF